MTKKTTVEERIFNLIEPALKKGADGKLDRYKTEWGGKTKIGLLSSIRRIIDEGAIIKTEYPEL